MFSPPGFDMFPTVRRQCRAHYFQMSGFRMAQPTTGLIPTAAARDKDASPIVPGSLSSVAFDPEMQMLLQVARAPLDPKGHVCSQLLSTKKIDWEHLIALARRHRMLPLLASHLREQNHLIPDRASRELSAVLFENARVVLKRTGQLLEALAALQSEGIQAVAYKGPALSMQLYDNMALRSAGDLDIIVTRRNVPRAREVLMSLGYSPRIPLDPAAVAFMVRSRYDENYRREDGGHIELHWAFTNSEFPFALEVEELLPRLQYVSLSGRSTPTFGLSDLLLILAVHGAKHGWNRLEWICSLAQLLRRADDIRWEDTLQNAERLGVRRTLFLALWLAHALLDAPLPSHMLDKIRRDRKVGVLAAQVPAFLAEEKPGWELEENLTRDRFRMLLRERWRDRVHFLWDRATTPGDPENWKFVRFGDLQFPVHSLSRPFRVVGKLLQSL